MRESLEVGRVLHEAEATTERHKRIPVEVMWLIWQHFFGQGYERTSPASLNPAGVM